MNCLQEKIIVLYAIKKLNGEISMALQIESIATDSPAAQARLQIGDILLNIGDIELISVDQLIDILSNATAKSPLSLRYYRNGTTSQVDLTEPQLGAGLEPINAPISVTKNTTVKVAVKTIDWQFKTRYSASNTISGITGILGWLTLIGGVVLCFIAFANSGDLSGVISSLFISVAGLAVIQLSQLTRAVTDSADHSREIMNMVALQFNKNKN